MTLFLIIAALLAAAALAAVLLPLLRPARDTDGAEAGALSLQVLREQLGELENESRAGTLDAAQYATERAEIERRAIEDGRAPVAAVSIGRPTWLAASLGLAVVALAVGLYLWLGTPAVMQPAAGQQQNAHALSPQQIQAMAAKLAERLQENPGDGEGWLMLARSYTALGRYPEAAAAYGRATSLIRDDATILSDYADTLAMAQGRRLQGAPEAIIQRALAADPRNIKALALAGSAAFERRDYAAAIAAWRRVLDVVPADSNVAVRIRSSIADAEARSGSDAGARPAAAPIRGVVTLDSKLRGKVADTDTVFVFARALSGSRMPLAIVRMSVKDLPARFSLDDSLGMGGARLSDQQQVQVGARVSRSGEATPRPGDLEGHVEPVAAGSDNVRVTISDMVQ